MNKLTTQRHLFSLPDDVHYLNCAYKAPLLKSAEEACYKALQRERTPYEIGPVEYYEEVEQVRASFARLVHSTADNIALIPSASYGIASVLNNTAPKSGGHAITLREEFPSGYFGLTTWCTNHQQELHDIAPDDVELVGESWNKNLLEAINEKTSLVLMSSVHWMNGIKFDLEAIGAKCKAMDVTFIVDGTQSVGALPMDVEACNIDALICAGYKWLMGPYSLGLMHVSDRFANGTPLEESWMNRTNAMQFSTLTEYDPEYKPAAGRYNVGETSNFILMPILKAGLQQVIDWEPERIQQYAGALIKPLISYLNALGINLEPSAYFCPHLFALKLPAKVDAQQLQANFKAQNIYLSVRGDYLRLAVNVFNDERDIEQLIKVISEALDASPVA